MASVVVTPTAQRNLARLIESHSLAPLRRFPMLGVQLSGRWAKFRFILGPWGWMIVIYRYYEDADEVRIIGVQDGRSARSPIR